MMRAARGRRLVVVNSFTCSVGNRAVLPSSSATARMRLLRHPLAGSVGRGTRSMAAFSASRDTTVFARDADSAVSGNHGRTRIGDAGRTSSCVPTLNATVNAAAAVPSSPPPLLPPSYGRVRRKSTLAVAPLMSDEYEESLDPSDAFPSIVVGPDGLVQPQGSFAEAQAQFLDPDPEAVADLGAALDQANMGIVAHYYMDVELQGVLQAVGRKQQSAAEDGSVSGGMVETRDINALPFSRVAIADSLAMGDHAVRMCRDLGVTSIACLGVDFMAESVAAILDKNGYGHVPVYRARADAIGCSLAESAERASYRVWLEKAAATNSALGRPALHVVYINTSLETKAVSTSVMPTITCTSSNVLKTILQASAQIGPDLQIYYGPDTYMGDNLVAMLDAILDHQGDDARGGDAAWDDERIARELHPEHNRESLGRLRDGMNVFPHGNCVVHHMFGADVVETVRSHYQDAFVTAHLEVPGEMFDIAMEKGLKGQGTVGSTSDILKFISAKVAEVAAQEPQTPQRLRFILGTEAGMVTSIVRNVQGILKEKGSKNVEAEIVFPVASEAVSAVDDHADLAVVPGVSGGEGCSTAGGCATCPFMKMNDLDALSDIADMINDNGKEGSVPEKLKGHLPPQRLKNKMLNGVSAADLGVEPIQHMRNFMKEKSLPQDLVRKILPNNA